MDLDLEDKLRPLLARVAGAIVPVVLVRVCKALGVEMPPELPGLVTDICGVLLVYLVTHRLISTKTNPGDAANATLAKVEKAEREALRPTDPTA